MGKEIDEERLWAALSYLWILFLIPLLTKKDSSFAQYHAKQGLVLFILSLAISIFIPVPVIGWFIIAPIGALINLFLVVIGLINALTGQKKPLPLIGAIAEKIKI